MLAFVTAIIALTLLALAFVVPVLFKKSTLEVETYDEQNIEIARGRLKELKADLDAGLIPQADFDQAKQELENRLALDLAAMNSASQTGAITQTGKQLAILLLVMVPLAAVALYSQLGRFDSVNGSVASVETQSTAPQMSMEEALLKLKQRLETEPENAEGWFMLARTYTSLGNYTDAVPAYERLIHLVGDDANILLRYADAMAMRDGGRVTGQPKQIIDKALELEPDHPQGLWLSGIADSQAGNFKQALISWYKLQPMLGDDAESLSQINAMIASVEQQLPANEVNELKAQHATQQIAAGNDAVGNAAEITVTVTLDAALADKVNDGDTLFIFARALEGPPMPLAVARMSATELPVTVTLSDAMAMMPALKLSNFDEVKVGANITRSGTATLSAGDLFGEVAPVKVTAGQPISLSINKIK